MINAKELRVGNKVSILQGFEVEVVGIYEDEILTDFEGNEGDYFNDKEEDVSGILLTEEWLLKYGFYKREYQIDGCDVYQKGQWRVALNYEQEYFVLYDRIISPTWELLRLKYVHQLQNLFFALTDEDLKLEK